MSRATACVFAALFIVGGARPVEAHGEPVNGFPSWYERTILVLTNEARSDPQTALTPCSDDACPERACYDGPRQPVYWDLNLNRASRFHADNLTKTGAGMQHDSPCDLSPTIGEDYPDTCDGSAACACLGGEVSCAGACPRFNARVGLFGVGSYAENIAWFGDPVDVFHAWLFENASEAACQWTYDKGHRWNILNGDLSTLGVGADNAYTVQDFGYGSHAEKIVAATHYPRAGSNITFMLNWRDSVGPTSAMVDVGGTCQPLSLTVGEAGNGTYTATAAVSGCTKYFFIAEDAQGNEIHYPTTGSFAIGCDEEYTTDRPAAGAGCSCTPSCAGKVCGDDGCGGSCGACSGANQTCTEFQCQCQHDGCEGSCCGAGEVCSNAVCCAPDCQGRTCGSDGCGGECGTCDATFICQQGACACPTGFGECAGQCADFGDPAHCGACDNVCPPATVCDRVSCTTECPGATRECGSACVDTETNPLHCGACDQPCRGGERCELGSCIRDGEEVGVSPNPDGGQTDAGLSDGGSVFVPTLDGDDGSAVSGSFGGCGCEVGGAPSAGWSLVAALVLILTLAIRPAR